MDIKNSSTNNQQCVIVMTILMIALVSSLSTLFISKNWYPSQICSNNNAQQRISFPKEIPQWDKVEKMHVPTKSVTVVRMEYENLCYVMPLSREQVSKNGRPLSLVNQALSNELVEQVAGSDATEFCQDRQTFLLTDPMKAQKRRFKRNENAETKSYDGTDEDTSTNGPVKEDEDSQHDRGVKGDRPSGLDLAYDKRTPRCMDFVLDCTAGGENAIGRVHTCYTWINGAMQMTQTCESATKFKVHLPKPPGRILKIAQQQWIICLKRRGEGKRC